MQGNGYYVTWAFGHLVQPAMPETYGMKGFHAENLPVIPDPFVLVPRQVKTENGYKPDAGVLAQIKIIGKLFDSSERIIVATDAGRAYLDRARAAGRSWMSDQLTQLDPGEVESIGSALPALERLLELDG